MPWRPITTHWHRSVVLCMRKQYSNFLNKIQLLMFRACHKTRLQCGSCVLFLCSQLQKRKKIHWVRSVGIVYLGLLPRTGSQKCPDPDETFIPRGVKLDSMCCPKNVLPLQAPFVSYFMNWITFWSHIILFYSSLVNKNTYFIHHGPL